MVHTYEHGTYVETRLVTYRHVTGTQHYEHQERALPSSRRRWWGGRLPHPLLYGRPTITACKTCMTGGRIQLVLANKNVPMYKCSIPHPHSTYDQCQYTRVGVRTLNRHLRKSAARYGSHPVPSPPSMCLLLAQGSFEQKGSHVNTASPCVRQRYQERATSFL